MSAVYVGRPTRTLLAACEQEAPERWANIPSAPGYQASTLGRIRSVDRIVERRGGAPQPRRGQILTPDHHKRANRLVVKTAGGVRRQVHRLVLEAFVGPCPDGMECCHKDGDSTNNRIDNLRWDTHEANVRERLEHFGGRRSPKPCAPSRKPRCVRGHLKVHPNLCRTRPERGGPGCLACHRARTEVRRQQLRGIATPDIEAIANTKYLAILEATFA